jgi:hypothetical protein
MMASKIFWTVASIACLLSIGFAFKHRGAGPIDRPSASDRLARSQEKDDWLTCLVVWGVIFAGSREFAPELQFVGAAILGWTGSRTLKRFALLRHSV